MGHPEVPEGTPYPDDGPGRISRADMALLRRAARERWNTPDEARSEAIYRLIEVLVDPLASNREKISAGRTLAYFDRTDQLAEKLEIDKARLAAKAATDADHAETVDPDDAARALRALNGGDASG